MIIGVRTSVLEYLAETQPSQSKIESTRTNASNLSISLKLREESFSIGSGENGLNVLNGVLKYSKNAR